MADSATLIDIEKTEAMKHQPVKKILDRQRSFTVYSNESYYRCAVTVPEGYTLEDCLTDEFWGNVLHYFKGNDFQQKKPRSGDIIEVRTDDNAWYAELYLLGVANETLKLKVLNYHNLTQRVEDEKSSYQLRWNLNKRGFDVIRKSDRTVVQPAENLPTKDMAVAWIEEYTKG